MTAGAGVETQRDHAGQKKRDDKPAVLAANCIDAIYGSSNVSGSENDTTEQQRDRGRQSHVGERAHSSVSSCRLETFRAASRDVSEN